MRKATADQPRVFRHQRWDCGSESDVKFNSDDCHSVKEGLNFGFLSFSCQFPHSLPRLSALTSAHSRSCMHTSAHADGRIYMGEWRKPNFILAWKSTPASYWLCSAFYTHQVYSAIATPIHMLSITLPGEMTQIVHFIVNSLKPLAIANAIMPCLSSHHTNCYSYLAMVRFAAELWNSWNNSKVSCSYNYWSVYSSWGFINRVTWLIAQPLGSLLKWLNRWLVLRNFMILMFPVHCLSLLLPVNTISDTSCGCGQSR